jgi:hypothetical protein
MPWIWHGKFQHIFWLIKNGANCTPEDWSSKILAAQTATGAETWQNF